MINPKTPPATRLRAAQIILNLATNPPMKLLKSVHKSALASAVAQHEPQLNPQPQPLVEVPENGPDASEADAGASACDVPEPEPEKMHNSAQSSAEPQQPYRRPTPKIGRNELCPCGSGKKFKRCCVDKLGAIPPSALEAA